MSESVIPAVVAKLIEKAEQALPGITVRYGYADPTKETEFVQFTDVEFTQDQQTMGMANREEEFTITGVVWVKQAGAGGTVALAALERALELMDAIETILIAESIAVSGVNLKYGEITRGRFSPGVTDTGLMGQLDFYVRFLADLG